MGEFIYKSSLGLNQRQRVVLKREAGKRFGESVEALSAFYDLYGDLEEKIEPAVYTALCIECMWRPEEIEEAEQLPFEIILNKFYKELPENRTSSFIDFLDIPMGMDGFLTDKLFRYAKAIKVRKPGLIPDFKKLTIDLVRWNEADRSVQREWLYCILGERRG